MISGLREDRRAWTLLHAAGAAPSYRRAKMLELCTPLALEPGEVVSIYVHSGLHSDTGIVYVRRADVSLMVAATRRYSVETSRGDAAAATRIVRGDESRRRRGWDRELLSRPARAT